MVEYEISLDFVFASLAHPTRRDILQRLQERELTVSEVAATYDMSLAAISKHLTLLQRAHLIIKRVQGNTRYVALDPATLRQTTDYLQQYKATWEHRLDTLEQLLQSE